MPKALSDFFTEWYNEQTMPKVGGRSVRIQATKQRPNDATPYAANDAIAESASAGTVWTFSGIAYASGGSGTIIAALAISDHAANVARLDVDLYTVAPTAINDNAEATQLAANIANYVSTISFQALAKKTTNSTFAAATPAALPRVPFKTSGSADLIGIVRTLDVYTPTAQSNYYIILFVLQD